MINHDAGHFMSDIEWNDWIASRAELAARSALPAENIKQASPKLKKATPARLAADLLRSAEEGDVSSISALLLLGANPNARERASRRRSAVKIAMDNGRPQAALALMRAGGWGAPNSRSGSDSKNFDDQSSQGSFSGVALDVAIGHTIDVFFASSSSWAHLTEAAQICRSAMPSVAPSSAQLTRRAASIGRWDMLDDAIESGERFDADCWKLALARLLNPYCSISGELIGKLASVVAHEDALSCMPPEAAHALFSLAIRLSSAALLESLLNARLRPSPDWMIQPDQNSLQVLRMRSTGESPDPYRQPVSLVLACSLDPHGQDLFKLAASCRPAIAAARLAKASPWRLAPLTVSRLLELDDLGISIDALDRAGNGLFHIWALSDSSPRSGWATLARKHPELFSLRNIDGDKAADIMASKLSALGSQEFFASLARMESRDIRQASAKAPVKSAASKPRQRL